MAALALVWAGTGARAEAIFPDRPVTFRYHETDIEEVLKDFSRWSGYAVVNQGGQPLATLDPLSGRPVQGRQVTPARGPVTVMSDGTISLEQAFFILQEVLRNLPPGYDAAANPEKKVIIVSPSAMSGGQLLQVTVGLDPAKVGAGDDLVKHVAFLKNLRGNQALRDNLQLLMPNGAWVILNDQANALIFVAPRAAVRNALTVLKELDEAVTTVSSVRVHMLKFAVARDLAETLRKIFSAQAPGQLGTSQGQVPTSSSFFPPPSPGAAASRGITIVEHVSTNSVVVMAPNDLHPVVEEAVKQLDKRPAQVMVETTIVEVALNDDLRHGVDWFMRTGQDSGNHNREGILQTPLSLVSLAGTAASGSLFSPSRYLFQFSQEKIDALLSLLQDRTNVKVVATPRIFATDNQKAKVGSISRVPFLTSVPGAPGQQATQNIDQREVGIKLELTPHINEDRTINMSIRQEVSSVGQQTFFGAPVVDSREAETNVLVQDGMSVILGGIMREETRAVDRQLPILGDLPLIGLLFRSAHNTTVKQELLVILSPKVVMEDAETKALFTPRDRDLLKRGQTP